MQKVDLCAAVMDEKKGERIQTLDEQREMSARNT